MSDSDINNEENMNNILGSAYGHTSPLPEYKARLLQELKNAAGTVAVRRSIWGMTEWIIIAAVIITLIIIYGLWVPGQIATQLVP